MLQRLKLKLDRVLAILRQSDGKVLQPHETGSRTRVHGTSSERFRKFFCVRTSNLDKLFEREFLILAVGD